MERIKRRTEIGGLKWDRDTIKNLKNDDLAIQSLNKLKMNFPDSEYIDKAEKLIN